MSNTIRVTICPHIDVAALPEAVAAVETKANYFEMPTEIYYEIRERAMRDVKAQLCAAFRNDYAPGFPLVNSDCADFVSSRIDTMLKKERRN